MKSIKDKLIEEIKYCIGSKIYNIQHNTATQREIQIAKECLGFFDLIKYSDLSIKEINELWKESQLIYQ